MNDEPQNEEKEKEDEKERTTNCREKCLLAAAFTCCLFSNCIEGNTSLNTLKRFSINSHSVGPTARTIFGIFMMHLKTRQVDEDAKRKERGRGWRREKRAAKELEKRRRPD